MESKKKKKLNVTVVIVNWNGYRDTKACLDSLAAIQETVASLHILVVDNGSKDASGKKIEKEYPFVHVLFSKQNLGFTGGNNIGIRYALKRGADVIWLLNNDTIVDPKALVSLKHFSNKEIGICGSKIYFAPGREFHKERYTRQERGRVIWFAGGIIDWKNMYASHRGVDEVDTGQFEETSDTPFVTGCSMMVRREVFQKIGLLDDRYYLYLEDVDFCLRATGAGFRLIVDPKSKLWHVNASSSDRPGNPLHQYYMTRNRLLLGFRYAPIRTRIALIREGMSVLFQGNAVRKKAVTDAFFGRFGNRFSLET